MKIVSLVFLFILIVFPVEAQSFKSNLIKTVANINDILHPNKMVRFTNNNYDAYYPTKINVNLQGDVICIDSLTSYSTKTNGIIFNVMKVKSFVIEKDEIVAFGHSHETIVAVQLVNELERRALRKELYALLFICNQYAVQDPKFKCY